VATSSHRHPSSPMPPQGFSAGYRRWRSSPPTPSASAYAPNTRHSSHAGRHRLELEKRAPLRWR
jgi:hypothetical protein